MPSINRTRPDFAIQQQQILSRQIAEQQNAIATGIRVARPSQDPAAWSQISSVGTEMGNIAAWLSNIDSVRATAAQVEDSLSQIADGLVRAKELAIQAASASTGAPARAIIAEEFRAVRAQISDILTSRDAQGQSLFPDGSALAVPVDRQTQLSGQLNRSEFGSILAVLDGALSAIVSGSDADRSQALTTVNALFDTLSTAQTRNGLVQQRLETLEVQHQQTGLVQSEWRSAARDTDISASISLMQKLMVNLQAAQASYARIAQNSLFDFLR